MVNPFGIVCRLNVIMEQLDSLVLSNCHEGLLPQTHRLFVTATPSGATHKHSQKLVAGVRAVRENHFWGGRAEKEEKKKESEKEKEKEKVKKFFGKYHVDLVAIVD